MEENEHIHKHLKQSLQNYSVQPRTSSFEAIRKKMEKKKRRRFLFFLFPGLLFMGGLAFYLLQPFSTTKITSGKLNPIAENEIQNDKPKNNTIQKRKESIQEYSPAENEVSNPDQEKTETDKISTRKNEPGALNDPNKISAPGPSDKIVTSSPGKSNVALNAIPQLSQLNLQVPMDGSGREDADNLPIPLQLLPLNERQDEIIVKNSDINIPDFNLQDTTPKKRKLSFVLGAAFNPQAGTYLFRKNREDDFSKLYLENKREQNTIKFNYAYGIKGGLVVKEKWEILAGFGFQKYVQEEKIKKLSGNGPAPTISSINAYALDSWIEKKTAEPNQTYKSIYKYWNYSVDVNRIIVLNKIIKIKVGTGLQVQKMKYSALFRRWNNIGWITAGEPDVYYYTNDPSSINHILCSVNLKAGWIEDLSKNIQVQLNPNLSYSLNSMFKKNYLIKQNSLNFGLECLLLFKIR